MDVGADAVPVEVGAQGVALMIFASGVIVVLIGAALGFSLALPLGVVGHEGSTVLVCLNGLRLLMIGRSQV